MYVGCIQIFVHFSFRHHITESYWAAGHPRFKISGTWDGLPVDHDPVVVSLEGDGDDLIVKIEAPFFGDPAPEGGKPGEAFFKLWEHEVVEAFFLKILQISYNQY